MAVDVSQLIGMTKAALDELFVAGEVGPAPHGRAVGTVIIAPGTFVTPDIAEFVSMFAWHGKTFDSARGILTNRILPCGLSVIAAHVYRNKSWIDGRECIVLDYSKTSLLFHDVRDEIRLVAPGLYLGKVFWKRTRLMDFCLEFPQ